MKQLHRDVPRHDPRILFVGHHWVARPLPEPPRTRHVSKVGRRPTDPLGIVLEEWMSEIRMGYTQPGD
ncbi:MAG: hypothetical protein KGK34_11365 [Chloroflexota bacterium]|nr:hypothetical protein [Chloroflexota bacterium]